MRRSRTQGCGSVLFLALASLVVVTNWCLISLANACPTHGSQEDLKYGVVTYGDLALIKEFIPLFVDRSLRDVQFDILFPILTISNCMPPVTYYRVPEPLASLFPLVHKIKRAPVDSQEHVDAKKQFDDIISKRRQEEHNFEQIKKSLFGQSFRDQTCLNKLTKIYESICGILSPYGSKHARDISDLCDAGVGALQMAEAAFRTYLRN